MSKEEHARLCLQAVCVADQPWCAGGAVLDDGPPEAGEAIIRAAQVYRAAQRPVCRRLCDSFL